MDCSAHYQNNYFLRLCNVFFPTVLLLKFLLEGFCVLDLLFLHKEAVVGVNGGYF